MEVRDIPISEVVPYENNPRNNDDAVELVANSIREFGFKQPIVCDADGTIIAGHTRYRAARLIGMDSIPVVYATDLTPEQVNAYRLADNKVAEAADWDMAKLEDELDGLIGFDMEQFGFLMDGSGDEEEEGQGAEVPFATELDEMREYIVIRIDRDIDWEQAQTVFELERKKRWNTSKRGGGAGGDAVCRVVTWDDFAERFLNA